MRFLIGIDLGTTNSALAYVDLDKRSPGVLEHFRVPQLVAPGEMQPRDLLPSFLYLPGPHDLPTGATALPWDPAAKDVVGEFARNHGSRIPGRLVTSAKSWLCHAGVDRSAPLLPWSAPPEVHRISPVEASTRYLKHLVDAWNAVHPGDPMQKQKVVLTVPASFDDMARNLTVDAARKAGLVDLALIEEPQAAFYCWLAVHSAVDAARIRPGDLCLVVDIGGGTTDFSLIQAVEQQGELGFLRQAVGDHLLLGGDNMDLALAKHVEAKLPSAGRLDAVQYGLLTQACRQAKEALLAPEPPASYSVTVMGRGRQVIGGSQTATLTADDIRQVLLDGFFPFVFFESEPARGARSGLHEMGLPYVSDPGITRHLAAFLKRHLGKAGMPAAPRALLFNGGVFTPESLRNRVVDALRKWFDRENQPWQPLVLTNPSLDAAVAWGAAYFAWLKHSGGRRIGGGIARSYYLGVGSAAKDGKITLVCVVPQHLEEGHEIELEQPKLELALGQPVQFPLYSSTVRTFDKAGDLLEVDVNQLLQLPPLHTVLRGGKRSGTKSVPVTLAVRVTEIGTLELFCVAAEGENRWRLEFNIRDIIRDPNDAPGAGGAGRRRRLARGTRPGRGGPHSEDVRAGPRFARSPPPDEVARSRSRGRPRPLADRSLPADGGLPRRGRRASPALSRASGALVQPRRILPAARLRRSARSLPGRVAVEVAARAEEGREDRRSGGGRRLLDHVASRLRRSQHGSPESTPLQAAGSVPCSCRRRTSSRRSRRRTNTPRCGEPPRVSSGSTRSKRSNSEPRFSSRRRGARCRRMSSSA